MEKEQTNTYISFGSGNQRKIILIRGRVVLPTWLATIIMSGVTAGVVSGFMTFWLKRIEYRNNYYRRIIDKRLTVYEIIEKDIFYALNSLRRFEGNKFSHAIFVNGIAGFQGFKVALTNVLQKKIWISNNTGHLLDKLEMGINEIRDIWIKMTSENKDIDEINKAFTGFGIRKFSFFRELHMDIEKAAKSDLKTLHKVWKYLKEERTLSADNIGVKKGAGRAFLGRHKRK